MGDLMSVYRCAICDNRGESDGGDCIPMLDVDGNETMDLVHESCATPEELHAYLPGVYPDPAKESNHRKARG